MQSEYGYIAEEIRRQVEDSLMSVGLLARVFARGKDKKSLSKKIDRDPTRYKKGGKMIQDAIGVRVALYFSEDISIVKSILESKYRIDLTSSTIDQPNSDHFSVTRYNLIFRLPEELADNFFRISGNAPLDSSFEVQLRSILSEGWHEVEHDLRYKAKENWNGHDDLSRTLNSLVATLETTEWTMARIFDELAHRHYKDRNWDAMLQNLFKLRLGGQLSAPLISALDNDPVAAKNLLRVDRPRLIKCLFEARPRIPVTTDNLVYFLNAIGPKCQSITTLTPTLILESAESLFLTATQGV